MLLLTFQLIGYIIGQKAVRFSFSREVSLVWLEWSRQQWDILNVFSSLPFLLCLLLGNSNCQIGITLRVVFAKSTRIPGEVKKNRARIVAVSLDLELV